MKRNYLIRLDDACPTMNREKWERMESILDRYGIKPMVGIVPDNMDDTLIIDNPDSDFWKKALEWQLKGWGIALHGYDHCYISYDPGINPMWNRSEFAGVALEIQKEKIRNGIDILKSKGIAPKYFFAPSHTFDVNTMVALKEESTIRVISDTIGRYPYIQGDFYFIPQITGHCVKIPLSGIYTFCFHPSLMNDVDFFNMEEFFKQNRDDIIAFDDINLREYGKKHLFDKFLSCVFFLYRKLRGMK